MVNILKRTGRLVVISVLTISALVPFLSNAPVAAASMDFTPQRKCTQAYLDGLTTTKKFVSPGQSIAAAVTALSNGDTLVINPGYYEITTEISIYNKTNVTICSGPTARPQIKMTANDWRIIGVSNSVGTHIEGLEVYSINDSKHDQVSGINIIEGSHHTEIWDNWAHDLPASGIGSARSNGFADIRYNKIWTTAAYSRYNQSALTLYFSRNTGQPPVDSNGYSDYIIGNMIWNSRRVSGHITDGNCIIIDSNIGNRTYAAYAGRTYIANNLCVANYGRGIHVAYSNNVDVVANTLWHNVRDGFDGHAGEMDSVYSANVHFVNNLVETTAPANVFDAYGMGANVTLAGNMFNGPTDRQFPGPGFTMIGSPMLTNPQSDPRNGDFHPLPGSVTINAGVASHLDVLMPTVDFTGKARTAATPTVGAFEPL